MIYRLDIINKLLKEYQIWTIKLKHSTKKIQDTVLQQDTTDALEEKIISIGISSVVVYIVTGVIGLFTAINNIVASIVFFGIGWVLSKFINKKIFGTPRKKEDLSENEINLFALLNQISKTHTKISKQIKEQQQTMNFTNYPILRKQFKDIIQGFNMFDRSVLALKYRAQFMVVTYKYKQQIKKFDEIYAHKG